MARGSKRIALFGAVRFFRAIFGGKIAAKIICSLQKYLRNILIRTKLPKRYNENKC